MGFPPGREVVYSVAGRRGPVLRRTGSTEMKQIPARPAVAPARIKPRLRGVSHQYAFFVSLITGLLLVVSAPTARAAVAAGTFAASLTLLLGVSALYHRVTWTPRARFWMARLDLAMIFVLIAGTYTPIALLALKGTLATVVLVGIWALAVLGTVLKVFWTDPPKWASACVYVAVGSVGVLFIPQVVSAVGGTGATLLGVGGLLYIAGALTYGLQRPDPVPTVFGYHEVFHALVIAAAAFHYLAVAIYVVPIAA